jgi:glycerol-3-phosphate O-acyltransferase
MPTALVGTVLLTLRGRGVGRNELIRKVQMLITEITKRNGTIADFGGVALDLIVDRALKVLGDLIGKRYDILELVYYPLQRFELSYYRNQVIHLFVHEALLCVSMYVVIKGGGSLKAQRINVTPDLVDYVGFISRLLKFEFVYDTKGLEANIYQTIQLLADQRVVDYNKEWVALSQLEKSTGREQYDFYCFLIWPFIDTYWLAAISAYTLLPPNTSKAFWVDDKLFMRRCLMLGKTLYYEGDLSYFEAINKETLGNALNRLQELGMIQRRSSLKTDDADYSGAGNEWIGLSKKWIPSKLPDNLNDIDSWLRFKPSGVLWDFCEDIARLIWFKLGIDAKVRIDETL